MRQDELQIFSGAEPLNPTNDNVDVEVRLRDGTRWSATFFTLENIDALFAKNRVTGECASGLYLWGGADAILVEQLDEAVIRRTIEGLVQADGFRVAFSRFLAATRLGQRPGMSPDRSGTPNDLRMSG